VMGAPHAALLLLVQLVQRPPRPAARYLWTA
jgi:hypothetical protein